MRAPSGHVKSAQEVQATHSFSSDNKIIVIFFIVIETIWTPWDFTQSTALCITP